MLTDSISENQESKTTKAPVDYLRLILTSRVYDVAQQTPLHYAQHLSRNLNNQILLKREDMQWPIFSFKIRGAYNRMVRLSAEERRRGVIAVSAGNHAQGVAVAAKHLKIPAVIVMPLCTPAIKYQSVQRLGAKVVLFGDDFDQAKEHCLKLMREHQLVNIHPYDDPYVIAGQGTVAVEIMQQAQHLDIEQDLVDGDGKTSEATEVMDGGDVDVIFCAVGGGGLIAGMTAYIKNIFPHVKIIGVETKDANAMYQSLKAGSRVQLDQVGLFADGAAVRLVGQENFAICKGNHDVQGIDEVILVNNDELCAAIKDCFVETRTILEPAGALGLAGLKKYVQQHHLSGKKLCAVLSGANMNFDRLRFIAERSRLGENKEVLMSVVIPERPGSFMKLHDVIYPRSITEFSYRFGDSEKAHIFLSFETQTPSDRKREVHSLIEELNTIDMLAMDVSGNEMAKTHARYLIGGRQHVTGERLFSFTFPERPGALRKFLKGLQADWNISLFHYRNFGADNGKVLVGIQVPETQKERFEDTFLTQLGYTFTEETHNPIYHQFLR